MNKQQTTTFIKYALVLLAGAVFGFVLKGKLTARAGMAFGAPSATTVLTQTLHKRPVALGKNFIARVEAINASDVTPQVSGYIDQVLFKEGSFVKEGEVLFVIDQNRYKANVSSAEADLEKAKATLKQIESDYHRELSLFKDKMLSQADLEVAESNLATAQANLKAAQAKLDLAKLDLEYTEVRSPISGYIGKALMTKGNYTNAASSRLARVIQMDPVRVVFSITDKERLSGMDQVTTSKPDLQIALPNGQTLEMPEAEVFSDNEINAATATMAVYAETENKDNRLIPGNYVNLTVSMDKFRPVILVPQAAVAQDAAGQYVMTVTPDNTVLQKYVTLGDMTGDQYVVVSGLEDGERIVPVGHQKLQNGQQVNVSDMDASAKAAPEQQEQEPSAPADEAAPETDTAQKE